MSLETKADEPEHSFLLEQRETSLLLFTTWTARNFTLKGRILYIDDDGTLYKVFSTADSITKKILPAEASKKPFPFQTTCSDGTIHQFNSISEEVREKCIAIFNFSSRTGKWFYPFDELTYNTPTMQVVGLPHQKPIYVPSTPTNNIFESHRPRDNRIPIKQRVHDLKDAAGNAIRSVSPFKGSSSGNNSNSNSRSNSRANSPLKVDRSIPPTISISTTTETTAVDNSLPLSMDSPPPVCIKPVPLKPIREATNEVSPAGDTVETKNNSSHVEC